MTQSTLCVGQKVIVSSNRWTPQGWEPIEQEAIVIDPLVTNDPVYLGDVEVKIEGELSRTFYAPVNVRPVEDVCTPPAPIATQQQQIKRIIGPTILMGDGAYFDFEFPDASGMTIEDYAWGLAASARFRGQTRYATDEPDWSPRCLYNVCQHVVLMARQMLADGLGPRVAYEGLMHESDEVVWGDFPGPAKALMPPEFKALVKRAGDAIDEHFGVTHDHKELVKRYDLRMLATEKHWLMPHSRTDQWAESAIYAPFQWRIACWDADWAARQFVALHGQIWQAIHG